MNKKENKNKELAELNFFAYALCMKFKMTDNDKNIDCNTYWENFKVQAIKYIEEKESTN